MTGVLVRGFRKVGEIVVRIVDERRVIIQKSDLVELLGLINCEEDGLGQVAKLRDAVRSCACPVLSGRESTARMWTEK